MEELLKPEAVRDTWFECELSPRDSCVWTLGPRLMVLFGKAIEGETSVEEVNGSG